jgi:hypothetical protein
MRLASSALVLCLAAAPLRAQSINIDASQQGIQSMPGQAYGAAASQPGPWSYVLGGTSWTLVDVHSNLVESASSSTQDPGTDLTFDNGATSGNDQQLLDDGRTFGPQGATSTWNIGPLFEGTYLVYTYAWNPQAPADPTQVSVAGALEPAQAVGGAWTGAHVLGTTYALHSVQVPAQGFVSVTCTALAAQGFVNGFQLVRQEPGIPFCFGDGSLGPCPCGNNSQPGLGRGCADSGAGSMNLFVCGRTAPADSIVLVSHTQANHSVGGLRVYIQGSTASAPTAFGDGLRCLDGTLLRLYARISTNGLGLAVPAAGDLSVSAQSAALGDPLAPGSTRYYTVYYRDPATWFCPPPGGSTFNVANAYELSW